MVTDEEALKWQVGIWDTISDTYESQIDVRFEPVVMGLVKRARLRLGDEVLDLGTGTGAVALKVAEVTGPSGKVVGVDISPEMVQIARRRAEREAAGSAIEFLEGRAEDIPSQDQSFDAVVAGLSFMYVLDREAASKECARVLRGGGRFAAAVWGPPDQCDIVLFQSTAGGFAPPPVAGVGPGALSDPSQFVDQLRRAGIVAEVEDEVISFDFPNFETAWQVLAGVTTASLDPDMVEIAKKAVQETMWSQPDAPRTFSNLTRFIVGRRNDS